MIKVSRPAPSVIAAAVVDSTTYSRDKENNDRFNITTATTSVAAFITTAATTYDNTIPSDPVNTEAVPPPHGYCPYSVDNPSLNNLACPAPPLPPKIFCNNSPTGSNILATANRNSNSDNKGVASGNSDKVYAVVMKGGGSATTSPAAATSTNNNNNINKTNCYSNNNKSRSSTPGFNNSQSPRSGQQQRAPRSTGATTSGNNQKSVAGRTVPSNNNHCNSNDNSRRLSSEDSNNKHKPTTTTTTTIATTTVGSYRTIPPSNNNNSTYRISCSSSSTTATNSSTAVAPAAVMSEEEEGALASSEEDDVGASGGGGELVIDDSAEEDPTPEPQNDTTNSATTLPPAGRRTTSTPCSSSGAAGIPSDPVMINGFAPSCSNGGCGKKAPGETDPGRSTGGTTTTNGYPPGPQSVPTKRTFTGPSHSGASSFPPRSSTIHHPPPMPGGSKSHPSGGSNIPNKQFSTRPPTSVPGVKSSSTTNATTHSQQQQQQQHRPLHNSTTTGGGGVKTGVVHHHQQQRQSQQHQSVRGPAPPACVTTGAAAFATTKQQERTGSCPQQQDAAGLKLRIKRPKGTKGGGDQQQQYHSSSSFQRNGTTGSSSSMLDAPSIGGGAPNAVVEPIAPPPPLAHKDLQHKYQRCGRPSAPAPLKRSPNAVPLTGGSTAATSTGRSPSVTDCSPTTAAAAQNSVPCTVAGVNKRSAVDNVVEPFPRTPKGRPPNSIVSPSSGYQLPGFNNAGPALKVRRLDPTVIIEDPRPPTCQNSNGTTHRSSNAKVSSPSIGTKDLVLNVPRARPSASATSSGRPAPTPGSGPESVPADPPAPSSCGSPAGCPSTSTATGGTVTLHSPRTDIKMEVTECPCSCGSSSKMDASTSVRSTGTVIDSKSLGPLEPGTSVALDAAVWVDSTDHGETRFILSSKMDASTSVRSIGTVIDSKSLSPIEPGTSVTMDAAVWVDSTDSDETPQFVLSLKMDASTVYAQPEL